jgi:uncharacterized membrane protein YeaQ/YmgE (transglycosylase-associated protein family)
MFHLVWILIVGLAIGGLGRLVLRGKQPIPVWMTILIGLVGAVAGDILSSVLGVRHTGGVDWIRHALQIGVAAGLITVAAPAWATRNIRR